MRTISVRIGQTPQGLVFPANSDGTQVYVPQFNSGTSVLTYYPGFPSDLTPATSTLTSGGPSTISTSNQTFNDKIFASGVSLSNGVTGTRFNRCYFGGQVYTGDGDPGSATDTILTDCEIFGVYSTGPSDSPAAIGQSDFSCIRCNVHHTAHGFAIRYNHVIKYCWMHDMGGNTDAHKDGVFSGGGNNVLIEQCTFDCCDGPLQGVTACIGFLDDFENQLNSVVKNNLLMTCGASALYCGGGPQKSFETLSGTYQGNRFGTKYSSTDGGQGPVSYFDENQPGNVWGGAGDLANIWYDGPNAGQTITPPPYG